MPDEPTQPKRLETDLMIVGAGPGALRWIVAGLAAAIIATSLACDKVREIYPKPTWKGFYYKSAEYPSSPLAERRMLDEAPGFSTLQDCMKWGSTMIASNPSDGFECSYGCRFDESFNALICKDTTKMIYLDRFRP